VTLLRCVSALRGNQGDIGIPRVKGLGQGRTVDTNGQVNATPVGSGAGIRTFFCAGCAIVLGEKRDAIPKSGQLNHAA
jgi:hypothetical protein